MMRKALLFAATKLALLATPVLAHVTLETPQAVVGAGYKAVFRVPHGCKGSPTVKVRVQFPEGVISVKPMPKPGWALDIVNGKYAKTYGFCHGAQLGEGVKEVVWSGGNLPDAFYDEFVLTGFLAADLKADAMLYFPVVQECEQGVERWIEIPAAGKGPGDVEKPAPRLRLLPAQ